jgi:hypothetical protein
MTYLVRLLACTIGHRLAFTCITEHRRRQTHKKPGGRTGTQDPCFRAAENNLPHIARLLCDLLIYIYRIYIQSNSVITSLKGPNILCRYKRVSLQPRSLNVAINSEELIGITKNMTLYTRRRINRNRYKRVRLYRPMCKLSHHCDERTRFQTQHLGLLCCQQI